PTVGSNPTATATGRAPDLEQRSGALVSSDTRDTIRYSLADRGLRGRSGREPAGACPVGRGVSRPGPARSVGACGLIPVRFGVPFGSAPVGALLIGRSCIGSELVRLIGVRCAAYALLWLRS